MIFMVKTCVWNTYITQLSYVIHKVTININSIWDLKIILSKKLFYQWKICLSLVRSLVRIQVYLFALYPLLSLKGIVLTNYSQKEIGIIQLVLTPFH